MYDLTSEQLDELESLFKYVPDSAIIEIDLPARGGLYRLRGDMARALIAQARRADEAQSWFVAYEVQKARAEQAERERDALATALAQVGATMTLACPECQGRMARMLGDKDFWEEGKPRRGAQAALAQPHDAGGA